MKFFLKPASCHRVHMIITTNLTAILGIGRQHSLGCGILTKIGHASAPSGGRQQECVGEPINLNRRERQGGSVESSRSQQSSHATPAQLQTRHEAPLEFEATGRDLHATCFRPMVHNSYRPPATTVKFYGVFSQDSSVKTANTGKLARIVPFVDPDSGSPGMLFVIAALVYTSFFRAQVRSVKEIISRRCCDSSALHRSGAHAAIPPIMIPPAWEGASTQPAFARSVSVAIRRSCQRKGHPLSVKQETWVPLGVPHTPNLRHVVQKYRIL